VSLTLTSLIDSFLTFDSASGLLSIAANDLNEETGSFVIELVLSTNTSEAVASNSIFLSVNEAEVEEEIKEET
jgi:hypothetical protein